MKKILCICLVILLAVSCMPFAVAQSSTRLYTVYGDGMLFQQNKEAVFAGEGTPASVIVAALFDAENELVTQGAGVVNSDGTFSVSFTAPSGSFDEYTVVLMQDGNIFDSLENVVFGELWLAAGQSNMQYPLGQAKHGMDMMANGQTSSKWLRVLLVPAYRNNSAQPAYIPDEPMQDVEGAHWIDGTSQGIYGMSAVAFYFAEDMLEELNMPVGILNAPLGGSSIASWISRKAADADAEYKNMLLSYGAYKESADWSADTQNVYTDIGANYNQKIEGLRHFRPVGMIWYQGESDIGYSDEYYSKAMDVMQSLYTEVFSYDVGQFPLIYTQLAEYFYTDDGMVLQDRNLAFTEMQSKKPDSRAVVAIYDLPITYIPAAGLIHPETKKEIGERMALAAKGLVYDKYDSYTAATVKETKVEDGCVYITFKNVGDGLVKIGEKLYGFAVCGADGVYAEANAEIISDDTVKVWNGNVKTPCSVTYAYCMGNGRSNLYASYSGQNPMPVSAFITDRTVGTHYWTDKRWADCESEKIWRTMSDTNSTYYSSWVGENADVCISQADAYEGVGGLNITAQPELMNKDFSVKPLLTYKDGIKTESFWDTDTDYSDYDTMSFYIRNNGETDVILEKVKFSKNSATWYAPAVNGTKDTSVTIPADGEWHLVTLDLNCSYLHGNEGGVGFTNEKLVNVKDIEFCFSGENGDDVDLSLDDVTFTPSAEDVKAQFDANFKAADSFLEYICVVITNFIGLFAKLFN